MCNQRVKVKRIVSTEVLGIKPVSTFIFIGSSVAVLTKKVPNTETPLFITTWAHLVLTDYLNLHHCLFSRFLPRRVASMGCGVHALRLYTPNVSLNL